MADKYVVNNVGLVATANAIRAKTGDSAGIVWDDSQGFASAISAIAGGAQVATGTVTVAGSGTLNSSPVVVSGFDFQPTKFIMYRTASSGIILSSSFVGLNLVWGIESQNTSTGLVNSDVIIVGSNMFIVENKNEYIGITANYGSVELRSKSTQEIYMSGGTYNWVAIG